MGVLRDLCVLKYFRYWLYKQIKNLEYFEECVHIVLSETEVLDQREKTEGQAEGEDDEDDEEDDANKKSN